MDLYKTALDFLQMKKHICGDNYFSLEMKITVILASDGRVFFGTATGNDSSEYNAFITMKTLGNLYIKQLICVDEYECVFLPSFRFLEYIVSDNENNGETFVYTDSSHMQPIFTFIRRKNDNFDIPAYHSEKTDDNDVWQDNAEPSDEWQDTINPPDEWQDNSNPPDEWQDNVNPPDEWQDNVNPPDEWQDNSNPSDEWHDNIVSSENHKDFADIESADSLAGEFEGFSDDSSVSKPVVVMKKENGNMMFENAQDKQFEIKGMEINYNNQINSINAEDNIVSENYKELEAGDHDVRPERKSPLSLLQAKKLAKIAKKNAKKHSSGR